MKTVRIIKIGGSQIDNKNSLGEIIRAFSDIDGPKVLVHGGGKLATELAGKLGLEVKMHRGRRITDQKSLELITMVYAGKINKELVVKLYANGCNAIGMSGADGDLIRAEKRPVEEIDYGYAGDIVAVNSTLISQLFEAGLIPVICSLTHDGYGQLLNTNADTIAAEIAIALSENYRTELIYCFDKPGVLYNKDDNNSVVRNLDLSIYRDLRNKKIIADGMLPKLKNGFYAKQNQVDKVILGLPELIGNQDSVCTELTL